MSKLKRAAITNILKTKLGAKNAANYEKSIYDMAARIAATIDEDVIATYERIAYEKCGELMVTSSKDQRDHIFQDIKTDIHGWESAVYAPQREKQIRFNQKLKDKGKLVKGAFYCRDKVRCKSDECYSYQSQTRSSDEGMTTFVICSKCGLRYRFG